MGHNMDKGSKNKSTSTTIDSWTSVLDLFPGYSEIFRQVHLSCYSCYLLLVTLVTLVTFILLLVWGSFASTEIFRIESKLKPVLQTQARLTTGNGPLPLPERHYIALMVWIAPLFLHLIRFTTPMFNIYFFLPGISIYNPFLPPQGSSITGCESLERLQVRIPDISQTTKR